MIEEGKKATSRPNGKEIDGERQSPRVSQDRDEGLLSRRLN
jgi:hypothetical protein